MAFELGRITEGDLPFIFPNVHDDKLENRALFRTTRDYFYGVYKDENTRKKVVGKKWVVDKERRAFMTNATATYRHNVGGESLEGVGGRYYRAIPHVEFLPYPSKGA